MILVLLFVTCAMAAATSLLLARLVVIPLLRRRGVLDQPGARSSHDAPVVRGGGIAVLGGAAIAAVLGVWLLGVADGSAELSVASVLPLAAAFAFGLVGFIDDLNSLSAMGRLVVQVLLAMMIALLVCLAGNLAFSAGLVIVVSLVLVVNGTNFMDGLNTLITVWGAATALWLAAWALVFGAVSLSVIVVAFACALIGFFPLNRTPAAAFLGDVGSYAIGGFLAVAGWVLWTYDAPTVIVLAPFVVPMSDVLFTLGSRMIRGENLFTAHRNHVYQRLTTTGLSHEQASALHLVAAALAAGAALPALALPGWRSALLAVLLWVTVVVVYISTPRLLQRGNHRTAAT